MVTILLVILVGLVVIGFISLALLSPRNDRLLRDELAGNRSELLLALGQSRKELSDSLKGVGDSLHRQVSDLTRRNDEKLEQLRETVEKQLHKILQDNATQLAAMRQTVDEKLQGTLERRLGESFKLVTERLEQVSRGLGEMQSLASGVGDLKRVLTNVKTRGTWGEVQLGNLLEQVLTPEQYATNVSTRGTAARVEFAIKLPGRGADPADVVWLPIDAKFPLEDYQRLVDTEEPAALKEAQKQLERQIQKCAIDISQKYLEPPKTTDFAILFLPNEGLFAEVLRIPALAEQLQRDHRVMIAGPTTLWSLLNALQMGFRTLTIQQRSSEVWRLLAAVKTEWSKYGAVLDKVQKKLQEASSSMDEAQKQTSKIGRSLQDVQALPADDIAAFLPSPEEAKV